MTEPSVPMVDLKAQYARIEAELGSRASPACWPPRTSSRARTARCSSGSSPPTAGCGHACGVANGTDALILALRAYGVGPGDEVVTVANTFIATGEAILLNGARPVFVDVDPETFTMDVGQVEAAITPRTKVILPVHLYGHPADMDAMDADRGAPRAARTRGRRAGPRRARSGTRRAGALGHAACFSFYPGKNLGAYGDAGMVTSNDAAFIERVRRLANHGGGTDKYDNVVLGTNSRLDTLQAAVLRVKLRHLDAWDEERRQRVAAYDEALAGIAGLLTPRERAGARSAWHLYTVRRPGGTPCRRTSRHAASRRRSTIPRPIHLQPAMASAGGRAGDLPGVGAAVRARCSACRSTPSCRSTRCGGSPERFARPWPTARG